jgi:WD40 repeat protein
LIASADVGKTGSPRVERDSLADYITSIRIKELRSLPSEGAVTALKFSAYGKLLAISGGDATIRLWEMERASQPRIISGHVGHGAIHGILVRWSTMLLCG